MTAWCCVYIKIRNLYIYYNRQQGVVQQYPLLHYICQSQKCCCTSTWSIWSLRVAHGVNEDRGLPHRCYLLVDHLHWFEVMEALCFAGVHLQQITDWGLSYVQSRWDGCFNNPQRNSGPHWSLAKTHNVNKTCLPRWVCLACPPLLNVERCHKRVLQHSETRPSTGVQSFHCGWKSQWLQMKNSHVVPPCSATHQRFRPRDPSESSQVGHMTEQHSQTVTNVSQHDCCWNNASKLWYVRSHQFHHVPQISIVSICGDHQCATNS